MEMHHRKLIISSSRMEEEEEEEMMDVIRRGPWTVEEDLALSNYIAEHDEGRWNSLARSAGLKRTGKSCRLRWLNYLRPDVRRGNITLEEQLLILELHSIWGNRWSKIAQQLPGRTDNEIKNYWRTRMQKQAKQLHCDVNSQKFRDLIRCLWMPPLLKRIHHSSHSTAAAMQSTLDITSTSLSTTTATTTTTTTTTDQITKQQLLQTDDHDRGVDDRRTCNAACCCRTSPPPSEEQEEDRSSILQQAAGFAAGCADDHHYCKSSCTDNLQIEDELLGSGDLSFWSFEDIWPMQ